MRWEMRHNMGRKERVTRVLLGIGLFAVSLWFGFIGMLVPQMVIAFLGLALAITGVFAYCPVNAWLHYNSCHACRVGETHGHLPV